MNRRDFLKTTAAIAAFAPIVGLAQKLQADDKSGTVNSITLTKTSANEKKELKPMNDTLKAIKERRSIRKFKPEMPKKEDLQQIIEAGLYAANGGGKQRTVIIAITKKELRDRLAAANCKIADIWPEGFDPFYGAPAILLVLGDKNWVTSVYDGSLVMGNLMLAAHSLGLGSIWIHRAKEEFEMPEFQKLLKDLGIEGEWEGIGHCAVGYVDGDIPKAAPRKENRVFWVE